MRMAAEKAKHGPAQMAPHSPRTKVKDCWSDSTEYMASVKSTGSNRMTTVRQTRRAVPPPTPLADAAGLSSARCSAGVEELPPQLKPLKKSLTRSLVICHTRADPKSYKLVVCHFLSGCSHSVRSFRTGFTHHQIHREVEGQVDQQQQPERVRVEVL